MPDNNHPVALRARCSCEYNTFHLDVCPHNGEIHILCSTCGKHIATVEPYGIEWHTEEPHEDTP